MPRTRFGPSRSIVAAALAAVTLLAFSATVVLAQTAAVTPGKDDKKQTNARSRSSAKKSIRRNIGGQKVAIDPTTGRLRQPTPEEAQQLSAALQGMLRATSIEELQVEELPDGTLLVDLQDLIADIAVATIGEEGQVKFGCTQDAAAADAIAKPGDARKPDQTGTAAKAAGKKSPAKPSTRKSQEEYR